MADYSQTVSFHASITVNLYVPGLQTKDQLQQWIQSDVARMHLIDHLKPQSFDEIEIIDAADEAVFIGE